ncbi:DUF2726 domain-containing protein [Brevundimonas faecalis]|uniref:DUF2726 domain-containing protein n=1 Tax=Brevundimonas faecalis TaxID=947378 RepID=A0ABV2R9B3_9CAUL
MPLSLVLIGSVLAVVVLGALGVFLAGREADRGRAKAEALQVEQALKTEILHKTQTIKALGQREAALIAQVDRLEAAEKKAREDAQQRRLRAIENDVTRHDNQMQNVEGCALRPSRPVNREASAVLYALEEWLEAKCRSEGRNKRWRLAFEVSMAAFVRTDFGADAEVQERAFSAYRGKRVDFLLIDANGLPMLAVEYNGTGHDLSDDAEDRMKVKRRVLERVGVPLLEIPARTTKAEMKRMVDDMLKVSAAAPLETVS